MYPVHAATQSDHLHTLNRVQQLDHEAKSAAEKTPKVEEKVTKTAETEIQWELWCIKRS